MSLYALVCRVLNLLGVNCLFFQLQDLRSLDRLLDNFVLGAYIYFLTKIFGVLSIVQIYGFSVLLDPMFWLHFQI
ncbi:hypothetical protein MtrunA17_Chr5g0426211 [Medicago truncatula]|uniref:Transmembrane protein n=1 Tax=Medicago truncatula TaxID=3880 RepID=A0A396HUC7_MEDTR|nr:hypothetical protein MtrunA17_Chr5g0426211 [Medicago truncatula]